MMDFLDKVLNITSLVVVLLPLMFLVLILSYQVSEKLHKVHKKWWISVPVFLLIGFSGSWLLGGALRRVVLIFGVSSS